MKKTFLSFFIIIMIFGLYSCGEKKTKNKENSKQTIEETSKQDTVNEESVFEITLNLIVPNDDTFEVFYLDYYTEKYSYKTKLSKKISGSPDPQDIVYKLPKEIFPTSLRIDFGMNANVENVILNKVIMKYEDLNLEISREEFHAFFVPNKYAKYNKELGVIERISVDGKFDPYFNSRALFVKKLELEQR